MKKRVFLAAMMALCFASINVWSQIYVEFQSPVKKGNRPYTPVSGAGSTVLVAADFVTNPSPDADDGFAVAQLPFNYEYNGVVYNYIAINVNGFIMFLDNNSVPLGLVGMQIQTRLFDGSQFPRNVIAPYWGDHYMRIGGFTEPGYMASNVLYQTQTIAKRDGTPGTERRFCVEWRNLNINDKTIPSSVGNFQVYLYEQTIPGNSQGDVEFAYGTVGGNPNTTLTTVITRNASVGMKGNANGGDWINGIVPGAASRTSTLLTNGWQPSGGTDTVIVLSAIPRLRLDIWGDGDADFSQAPGERHNGKPQNQFVTAADALTVLRSIATNIPLDSLYRRQAYKADVDHNGRFYYSTRNATNTADVAKYRREVPFRTPSNDHTANMPNDNSLDYNAIYFQVGAYDAALIMHYLSARIVMLPWTLDSIVPYGKVSTYERANNIALNGIESNHNNTYRIPVYMNGDYNGAVSAVFNVNGKVINVETNDSRNVIGVFNGNKVAIAGGVNIDATQPIAYVTVETNQNSIEFSNVQFNDENRNSVSLSLNSATNSGESLIKSPNPFYGTTKIMVSIPEAGEYKLAVYDAFGKQIKTLANGIMNSGSQSFDWNGTNENGNDVAAGVYIYRLEGNNVSATQKVVLNR